MCIFKPWNPAIEKADDVFIHRDKSLLSLQKINDRAIKPCQSPQVGFPVWVWQAAHIKNEVGVRWNTMFESE